MIRTISMEIQIVFPLEREIISGIWKTGKKICNESPASAFKIFGHYFQEDPKIFRYIQCKHIIKAI